MQLSFLFVLVITLSLMLKEKSCVPHGEVLRDGLSNKQKVVIIFLCLFNPVIAGTIFYYGWKKKLPVKAKQANTISVWAFVCILVIGMLSFVLFTSA